MNNTSNYLLIILLFAAISITWKTNGLCTEMEVMSFKLSQSTSDYTFWTSPPSERIFKDTPLPAETGSIVKVYSAKNEVEPFQIIVNPDISGQVSVSIADFGSGISTEIYQVKYVSLTDSTDYFGRTGDNPDPLWPIANGETLSLSAGQNCALWFSVSVPPSTPPGDYSIVVTIGGINIPVTLHVFNFTLPDELHVKSQMNFSYSTLLNHYSVPGTDAEYWSYIDRVKQFFIDHRLTPKSVLWPGGVTSNGGAPFIDYDCNGLLSDNDGIWGFELPSERYLDGEGIMAGKFTEPFNDGTGYPSFMAATFTNNDASVDQRPGTFCGQTRTAADWYTADNPGSAYNVKWFAYISSLENYLQSLDQLDRAYYYIANEPQDHADYDAVAWYSQELKKAAPNLKLMVSEEPKPEIYNHADYPGVKIDIWLAHLGMQFDPSISFDRQANHGEETWIYFLHGTRLPRFNPLTIDHPGIEGKLTGWFLWKYRLRGIGYYQFNTWSPNPWTTPMDYGQNGNRFLMYPPSESGAPIQYGSNNHRFVPSIRLEMIRDGLEDYEYLYLLNNGSSPQPYVENPSDFQVGKIIGDTVAYSRDSTFLYNLRKVIGMKLGGEIESIPNLAPFSEHQRSDGLPGNYYINFQDPNGEPVASPLVVDGHTYMKIGDDRYDPYVGYGWIPASEVPDTDFYPAWDQWIDPEPKELLGSSVIDSWGRHDVFEFDLPNGLYNVTACAGSRSSPRYQNVTIEGVNFFDDEETNNSWLTKTKLVEVRDKKLTLVMGKYERIGYINYLNIEAADISGDINCDKSVNLKDVITLLQLTTGQNPDMSNCESIPADVSGDDRLGIGDAIWILEELASDG